MQINTQKTVRILIFLACSLVGLHLIVTYLHLVHGHDRIYGLLEFFDLDFEQNAPATFSSLLLLFSALLLGLHSRAASSKKDWKNAFWWGLLSVMFLYLTLDEALEFHESIGADVNRMIPLKNSIHGWMIPYAILTFGMTLIFFKFWCSLAPKLRIRVLVSFILYVGGALGFELLAASFIETHGYSDLRTPGSAIAFQYYALVTVEESLEMAGLIVFIHALLDNLKKN